MIISTALTIPAKTPSTSPIAQTLKVGKGTLTRVAIDVPDGPNWEVYVRVRHLESNIIPDKEDEWLPVNGHLYEFAPLYTHWQGIYEVALQACSPQARFSHSIEVTLEVNELGTTEELLDRLLRFGS